MRRFTGCFYSNPVKGRKRKVSSGKLINSFLLRVIPIVLVILMILVSSAASARKQGQERIDSLRQQLLLHQKDDSAKVDLYYALSFESYSIDPLKGILYGKTGISLAEKLHYKSGLTYCLISVGVSYWAKSDYPKALEHLFRALEIAEETRNIQAIAKSAGNLGNVYADLDDFPRALAYYNKALKISQQLGDTLSMARRMGNIGTVYKEIKDYPRALIYYKEAYRFYVSKDEKRGMSVSLANIGWVYAELKKFRESISYYEKGLKVAEESGENRWIMFCYGNMGMDWYDLARDTSTPDLRAAIAKLSVPEKKEMLNRASQYLLKAIDAGKNTSALKGMIDYYMTLSHIYKDNGDWKNAYNTFVLSHAMKDSLNKVDRRDEVARLEARKSIDLKEKELQLQEFKLQNVVFQRAAFALGSVLLLIILFLIYQSRQKSEKLLLNMLPAKIAKRLKNKEKPIADLFDEAAVVFIDIVEFTQFSRDREPGYLITVLTDFFTRLDDLAEKYGMEKIKTIGDSYLAVSGIPEPATDSVERACKFAIECRDLMRIYKTSDGHEIKVRIGIDAGQVVAGVIGEKKFSYDLWGDVVNTASRMESQGIPGEVQITDNVAVKLQGKFTMRERGNIEVKGRGIMRTWVLID